MRSSAGGIIEPSMYVVGVARLSTSLQEEAPRLASDLGMTAYEARMLLAPGIPALLLVSPDKSQALNLLAALRARGHEALAFDSQAVVSSDAMVSPHTLQVRNDGFLSLRPESDHLLFSEVHIVLRATHEVRLDESVETHKRKFSAGRALLTGGLVMTKKTSSSSTSHSYEKQEVLYVHRHGGKRPWLLREKGIRYEGLGDRLAATERANFLTVVEILRSSARTAVFDEGLVGRKIPDRLAQVAIQSMSSSSSAVEVSSDAAMDLLCHFVAMWYAKRAERKG
jgi:hypothetical protein